MFPAESHTTINVLPLAVAVMLASCSASVTFSLSTPFRRSKKLNLRHSNIAIRVPVLYRLVRAFLYEGVFCGNIALRII
uniref:Putative secreted peptide n=1 Tax=Anopheles braziliensis TaxID=58242 RepID=A0A2M3ZVM0_9DIPT